MPIGHEYVGIVEEVGRDVKNIERGQFVVGSFFASDNTCEICRSGYQTASIRRQPGAPTGAQAEYTRIALADGTLVATPELPPADMVARLPRRVNWIGVVGECRPGGGWLFAGQAPNSTQRTPAGECRGIVAHVEIAPLAYH